MFTEFESSSFAQEFSELGKGLEKSLKSSFKLTWILWSRSKWALRGIGGLFFEKPKLYLKFSPGKREEIAAGAPQNNVGLWSHPPSQFF